MKLNFRKYGSGAPLFILHGVFGSSDNWQTVGKQLADKYTVYLIDLRNHGLSPHSEEMDYPLMSGDLLELMGFEGLSQVVVMGHSMGGKVAMHLAVNNPGAVSKLVVVDIAPKEYPPHHQEIFEGFDAVKLATLTSRKEADNQMSHVIKNPGIRQFILKNLTRTDDGFAWKLNLKAIRENIENVGRHSLGDLKYERPTLFISGSDSNYITKSSEAQIKGYFPKAQIITISGAGHWVHAEKPSELFSEVSSFLDA